MDRRYRLVSSVILSAALMVPVGRMAVAQQREEIKEHDEHDRREDQRRYYDRVHGDYHEWGQNEERVYQRYREERHLNHEFAELSEQQQREYWNWRHQHSDER